MKKSYFAAAAAALALAACGQQSGGSGAQGQQIQIVGSSTVYPFTTAVAEQFQRTNPGMSAIVESTGTGAGLKLFCAGVGDQHPDMTNASRRIKASEFQDCAKNGVKQVIEVPGRDRRPGPDRGQERRRHGPDGPRRLRRARRQSVRQAQHRQDLEGRQPGASGRGDPGLRPAADFRALATASPS